MKMSTHLRSYKLDIQLTASIHLVEKFLFQTVVSFAKIGNNSGLRFLTNTGILSGPVAFIASRIFISLEISQNLCSMRGRIHVGNGPCHRVWS